jgi:hypothetical protein
MAITSLSDFYSAARQDIAIAKLASITAVGGSFSQIMHLVGTPGAGTLAGTNTANGLVPTDATAGCPPIAAFSGGKGYLSSVSFGSTVVSRLRLVDVLFKAGAYSFNSNVTLASQPSYSGRVPGGTDFRGTEIWLEAVTAFTGNQSIAITYVDQDNNTAESTGTIATGLAPIIGRMYQIPFNAGDCGVRQINVVTSSVATVGTFNVLVVRPLWEGVVGVAGLGDTHGPEKTGMPEVYTDSALMLLVQPVSTATGIPWFKATILDK